MTQVQKQKISDLAPEEQEKIITQLRELKVQGAALAKTWTVENANKKIAAALVKETPAVPPAETPAAPPAETPAAPPAETPAAPLAETPVAPPVEAPVAPPAETPVAPPAEIPAAKAVKEIKEEKLLKCHICRSDVKDGKCIGCGFSLGV